MSRIELQVPSAAWRARFLDAVRRSQALHHPWVKPPASAAAFDAYLKKLRGDRELGFFVLSPEGELAGVVNVNEIVRGAFQSAYLGYYAFLPQAGRGLMRAGLRKVVSRAFRDYRLHRLEANIQPENSASRHLVKGLGFALEGLSPRYLKIAGRWRDHERWAIRAENWPPPERRGES